LAVFALNVLAVRDDFAGSRFGGSRLGSHRKRLFDLQTSDLSFVILVGFETRAS